ncbi:hypothetical protein [Actinocorallia populi]|uniref:hypothetical protein n=1 Tax=Actinocorallia populi TaxID=2079200 RepID=UPI000D08D92A|nr:hypothetical protein [Actinocorallia populi]
MRSITGLFADERHRCGGLEHAELLPDHEHMNLRGKIAAALISLGAAMHDAVVPLIEDPGLSLKIRNTARVTAEAAETLRIHYGGDGGGW